MASRNLKDLHPELVSRWKAAYATWKEKYPDDPEPFITCTFRSPEEQTETYAQGRTKPGKVVSNARAHQSLHNYLPSLSFDLCFRVGQKLFWDIKFFRKFAQIIKPMAIEWGGDWKNFKDYAHFQPRNFTWRDAKAKKEPTWS